MIDGCGVFWEEEIYYDSYDDVYVDMFEYDIEFDEDYFIEEEEDELDDF